LVRLSLKPPHDHLAEGPLLAQLEQRLGSALGRSIKLKFERDSGGAASPAELRARAESARHAAAENAVHADPLVQSLIDTFGAHVIPESIRPTDS
ncbi:MAG: DNA polymerase III subunit gamma/tau C-terminal domain-containing protein, partial [Dokdonella sp.]